jgi:hypothetical protein
MKRMILALLLGSLLGCGSNGEFVVGNATQTLLQGNNYRVVMTGVRGEDSGFRVFGIGTDPQYSTCMEKIRVLAELEGRSRALANVSEDRFWFNIGIVSRSSIKITADVIEFTGPPNGGQ